MKQIYLLTLIIAFFSSGSYALSNFTSKDTFSNHRNSSAPIKNTMATSLPMQVATNINTGGSINNAPMPISGQAMPLSANPSTLSGSYNSQSGTAVRRNSNSNSPIVGTSASGEANTTVVDQNGNLKIVEKPAPQQPNTLTPNNAPANTMGNVPMNNSMPSGGAAASPPPVAAGSQEMQNTLQPPPAQGASMSNGAPTTASPNANAVVPNPNNMPPAQQQSTTETIPSTTSIGSE